jgi:hypothetical protein
LYARTNGFLFFEKLFVPGIFFLEEKGGATQSFFTYFRAGKWLCLNLYFGAALLTLALLNSLLILLSPISLIDCAFYKEIKGVYG